MLELLNCHSDDWNEKERVIRSTQRSPMGMGNVVATKNWRKCAWTQTVKT
jgi:hypothetical protein